MSVTTVVYNDRFLVSYALMKIQVIFYSMYGHVYRMAEAIAEGAREVSGADVTIYQVAELIPEEALVRTGASQARAAFAHIPIAEPAMMTEADAIIFGTPTRFGSMAAQMRNFLDQTGQLWAKGLDRQGRQRVYIDGHPARRA